MGKGRERFPVVPHKKVVWWDISSCPLPKDYNPFCVRPSIESAFYKSCGSDLSLDLEEEVTIFAVGNLIPLSPYDSEELSSTGILMRHTALCSLRLIFSEMLKWLDRNPHPATLMLISDDPDAYQYVLVLAGEEPRHTVIPAYPPDVIPTSSTCSAEWRWETILKESLLLETPSQEPNYPEGGKTRWFCRDCDIEMDFCDDFINHVYDFDHAKELYDITHFPPTGIDIYNQFLQDQARMAREFPELPYKDPSLAGRDQSEEEYLKHKEEEEDKILQDLEQVSISGHQDTFVVGSLLSEKEAGIPQGEGEGEGE